MFEKIKAAYMLGKESAALSENLFWFHPHLVKAHNQYALQKELWRRRKDEIKNFIKTFGLIEKIAYELGDEMNSTSVEDLPLLIPRAA